MSLPVHEHFTRKVFGNVLDRHSKAAKLDPLELAKLHAQALFPVLVCGILNNGTERRQNRVPVAIERRKPDYMDYDYSVALDRGFPKSQLYADLTERLVARARAVVEKEHPGTFAAQESRVRQTVLPALFAELRNIGQRHVSKFPATLARTRTNPAQYYVLDMDLHYDLLQAFEKASNLRKDPRFKPFFYR